VGGWGRAYRRFFRGHVANLTAAGGLARWYWISPAIRAFHSWAAGFTAQLDRSRPATRAAASLLRRAFSFSRM
jgi:hypothetical protein